MTQLPPPSDGADRRRRRSTTDQRPTNAMNGLPEPGGDGFWYATDIPAPQQAGFNPLRINELNQTYQMNTVPNLPPRAGTTAMTFPQAPSPGLAVTSNQMTASTRCPIDATPGSTSVLNHAFNPNLSYSNPIRPPMQPASSVSIPRQPPVFSDRVVPEPGRPTASNPQERPTPCKGHPAPGWCYLCKWHHTSCDQVAHPDDRYCFHCMKSRPWDGEERRD